MNKVLSTKDKEHLLGVLQKRFESNRSRHPKVEWADIEAKLANNGMKLWSLFQMEESGGEPDVVGDKDENGEYSYIDCCTESPIGRRSVCYDLEGLESRKEHKPKDNAMDMAEEMGVELLDENLYRKLQEYGKFDNKTSSWIASPEDIRKLGGALFGERRYAQVFFYHNGAQSYYAARGFRAILKV